MDGMNRFAWGRGVRGWAWALVGLCAVAFGGSARPAGAGEASALQVPAQAALRELGRRLFFDPAGSSRSGMRACVDCHRPEHGFADPEPKSPDDLALTTRHSQSLIDAGESPSAHWDGEFSSMHDLVTGRLNVRFLPDGRAVYGGGGGSVGVGNGSFVSVGSGGTVSGFEIRNEESEIDVVEDASVALTGFVVTELLQQADAFRPFVRPSFAVGLPPASASLAASGRYGDAFRAAFAGDPTPTDARIALAISEFCHSIRSGESPYDRHARGDPTALSASAKRGLALFAGKAGCAACHSMGGERDRFSDDRFHDTGISWKEVVSSTRGRRSRGDLGRHVRTRASADVRAFKTPSLRDVARSAPYMHDGSLATLEDVVRHYSTRPGDPNLDPAFPTFSPSDDEVADLVAFLRSLTSDERPGRATEAWDARVPATRLRFLDAAGRAMAGLRVTLVPAGDELPGAGAAPAEPCVAWTRDDGSLVFEPGATTHTRLVLGGGLRPVGGDLVPDTCAAADVVLPVDGVATLVVLWRDAEPPPATLVARHPGAERFPDRRPIESRFRRTALDRTTDGWSMASYEARRRTDVGGSGTVEWTTAGGARERVDVAFDAAFTTILTLR